MQPLPIETEGLGRLWGIRAVLVYGYVKGHALNHPFHPQTFPSGFSAQLVLKPYSLCWESSCQDTSRPFPVRKQS